MRRTMCKSKIHSCLLTGADLYYEGSLTIDRDLMDAADILPFEKLQVVNINTGARLETYAIEGPRGSGTIQLNGAAARSGAAGDHVIVMSYGSMRWRSCSAWSRRSSSWTSTTASGTAAGGARR